MQLNLNADLGESFGPWPMGNDAELLQVVNTANVACGYHAGDPLVMSDTIGQARDLNVSIGAHPGFPDLQGFGRRPMTIPPAELSAMLHYQLAAIDGMSRARGFPITHVKPHGALNNMACEDPQLAETIVQSVEEYDQGLIFLAPVLSELAKAAAQTNLTVALEIFADRAYTESGSLVSRRLPGAVLEHSEDCIKHVESMINSGGVVTREGSVLETEFHSICVHGDNDHAVHTAKLIREALIEKGHTLVGLPALLHPV